MHSTTKEVIVSEEQAKKYKLPEGAHVLTTIVEADGPFEMASEKADIDADVISVKRTASGGVEIVSYFDINEPAAEVVEIPQPERIPTPQELATEYLVQEKGLSELQAADAVSKFGASNILKKKNAERDRQLDVLLESPAGANAAAVPAAPGEPKQLTNGANDEQQA